MINKIAEMLDSIADRLEAQGLIKEAYEIDRISVNLEDYKNNPPSQFAPPGDIDALFPNVPIKWKFSTSNDYVLVLSNKEFSKEMLKNIVSNNNFEKIGFVKEGIVFFFKNTYRVLSK